jgi:hypothetical protein
LQVAENDNDSDEADLHGLIATKTGKDAGNGIVRRR